MTYDSRKETQEHIRQVRENLDQVRNNLIERAAHHDKSKLLEPEKSVFDRVTPKLKELTYGSEEYKQSLTELGTALTHHYENNDHHPEHWPNGVYDMSLLSLTEMLCDWYAATKRHADGSLEKSFEVNGPRFGISQELLHILWNTAKELGWIEEPSSQED